MTRAEIIKEIKSMPTRHQIKCRELSDLSISTWKNLLEPGTICCSHAATLRLIEIAIEKTYEYFEALETLKKYR